MQDYEEALRWLRLAAGQGNAVGQGVLGAAYFFGHGVGQDYRQAIHWVSLAAERGDARAQGLLGAAYYLGRGVARDYVTAHTWLNRAAVAGDESARTLRAEVAEHMTREQVAEAQERRPNP